MLITNHIEKRDEDMKAGAQGAAVLTQAFDDEGALLGHHDGGLSDDDDDKESERDDDDKSTHSISVSSLLAPDKDREAFDPFDFAAFAARQRLVTDVARVPGSPAQLCLADGVDRDLIDSHGGFTDQTVDSFARHALGQAQQFFTKQPEGDNREDREQNELKP